MPHVLCFLSAHNSKVYKTERVWLALLLENLSEHVLKQCIDDDGNGTLFFFMRSINLSSER